MGCESVRVYCAATYLLISAPTEMSVHSWFPPCQMLPWGSGCAPTLLNVFSCPWNSSGPQPCSLLLPAVTPRHSWNKSGGSILILVCILFQVQITVMLQCYSSDSLVISLFWSYHCFGALSWGLYTFGEKIEVRKKQSAPETNLHRCMKLWVPNRWHLDDVLWAVYWERYLQLAWCLSFLQLQTAHCS